VAGQEVIGVRRKSGKNTVTLWLSRDFRLSRDRRKRSKLYCLEDSHSITLRIDDIPNRCRHTLWLPQPPRTSMPCPALSMWVIQPNVVQAAARIGFQVVHDSLGPSIPFHHYMNLITVHVGGQQPPPAICAAFQHGG
jgi:hypothetical protein